MSINKYNCENYNDPTAYEAMTNIKKEAELIRFKPLVYICSPFAGDTKLNTIRARDYSRFAVSMNAIPLAPHLLFPQFMEDWDKEERKKAIFMGLVLLTKCQEIWCFGTKISNGMEIELEKAKKRKMVIKYFNEKCEEVASR